MRLEKGYVQNDFVCFNIFCCIFADATLSTTESGHDLVFHASQFFSEIQVGFNNKESE